MKKCCIRTCISTLICLVLFVVGIVVLLNLTPAQLHVNNIKSGEKSLDDYGLSDVKLINIIKGVGSLNKKEEKVVDKSFSASTEMQSATTLFAHSNVSSTDSYANIGSENIVFDNRYVRVVNDTTLAFLLDEVVKEMYSVQMSEESDPFSVMTVREVNITKTEVEGEEKASMRLVLGVAIKNFLANLSEEVQPYLSKLPLPEYAFIVCDAAFDVATEGADAGKIIFGDITANFGGVEDNPLNELFFEVLDKMIMRTQVIDSISAGGDGSYAETDSAFCRSILEKVATVISHLGKIGTANTVEGVVAGEVKYGLNGVDNGKLIIAVNSH